MQVGLVHELFGPAGDLGDDARGHVHDEAVLAVQQVQEREPQGVAFASGVFMENLHASLILLKQNIAHNYTIALCNKFLMKWPNLYIN